MKAFMTLGLAVALAATVGLVRADDLKSGPQVGDSLAAFDVTKVAGAPHDNVEVGKELCYRCKLGNRPVVMVFARKVDSGLTMLTKELDATVAKNSDKKMGSFVNLLGEKTETLTADAKKLAEEAKLANVAVVVPVDHAKGPADYSINPKAQTTVLIYKAGKVVANHSTDSALDETAVKKIIADTAKILN